MAKKFIFRSFKPGYQEHKHQNPLINLSSLGLTNNADILTVSLGIGQNEQNDADQFYSDFYSATGYNKFSKYRDITKNQTNNYAYFNQSYDQRRTACRQLAQNKEIDFVLDTITNEAIVQDANGFIAQLDIDKLKLMLNKNYKNNASNTDADKLIRDCKIAFNNVYANLGWDDTNGAWQTFKQFLIDGFIALEILIDQKTKIVKGFKELDPFSLKPDIITTEDGKELMVWYQNYGEHNQTMIPDSNIIYIAWDSKATDNSNYISYVEGLTRPYTMLKTLEDSHAIENVLKAQRFIKVTVPMENQAPQKAEARLSEVRSAYTEEVSIDSRSGQILFNGEPNWNYQKTMIVEDRGGRSINMEAVDMGGYDLNIESLQYYWRKYIMQTQVPANRFNLNITAPPANQMLGDANITREEYAFRRFIQRIQGMFKEVLLKPIWVQICLQYPFLSYSDYIKQGLGIIFNEENLFTLAKKRAIIADGANAVSTILGIQDSEGKSVFAPDWAIKEFMGLTDDDLEENRKYIEAEIIRRIKIAKLIKKHSSEQLGATPGEGPGGDMGGGGFGGFDNGDMGGGFGGSSDGDVMSGGEFGGPEPADTGPEPADTGGDDGGGF